MRRWIPALVLLPVLALSACSWLPGAEDDLPQLSAEERAQAEQVFTAADAVREALAADELHQAHAAAEPLRQALSAFPPSELQTARDGLTALGAATDLDGARDAYSDIALGLVRLASRDARLQERWQLYRCPMTDHHGQWVQPPGAMANPYMGTAMLQCGVEEDWAPAAEPAADEDAADYYTCPMHPSVHLDDPSAPCPICGMDLVPAYDTGDGAVFVDSVRRQELGIRTAVATRGAVGGTVALTGLVAGEEGARSEVTVRTAGFVERLWVDETGATVRRGQPLVGLYSPEVYATQGDLLRTVGDDALHAAARRRLSLYGLTDGQIDRILADGEVQRVVPLLAPRSGVVTALDVIDGQAVQPGQRLYEVSDLSHVYVEAQVFESDLPHLSVGQVAEITVEGQSWQGTVASVLPSVQAGSRTATARIEVDNDEGALKLGAYAAVALQLPASEGVLIPTEAVIHNGARRVVFLDEGEGRLVPTDVVLGRSDGEQVLVREGVSEGDVVVASGNFLIAAESRLRAATGFWGRHE